eukprot:3746114-Karenia_brevis.AAC.1
MAPDPGSSTPAGNPQAFHPQQSMPKAPQIDTPGPTIVEFPSGDAIGGLAAQARAAGSAMLSHKLGGSQRL